MSYKSILLNINIEGPIAPSVRAVLDLAQCHEAKLIGHCAADAPLPIAGPEGASLAAEVWQQMRDDIARRFKEIHAEFEGLTATSTNIEWRSTLTSPTRAVIEVSRAADIIIMTSPESGKSESAYRVADPANIVLQAGRPVLILANKVEQIRTRRIAIAWKDTREARRAVCDALPLLTAADEVIVVTVAAHTDSWIRESLADVVAHLAAHGVKAKSELIEGSDDSLELLAFLDNCHADLIVSGAYGHSRLREWAFGGVTRSLLHEARFNRFMSS